MKILVLGAGMMCTGVVFDLLKNSDIKSVTVVDSSKKALDKFRDRFRDERITALRLDISKTEPLLDLMAKSNCVINASHYKFNYDLSKACIEAGTNFCDMGGNVDVVDKQLCLNESAKEKGVTIIPDCGLAPGMVSVVLMHYSKDFDEIETARIRVGGVPQKPKTELKYQLVFSVEGLINEYIEKAVVLKQGEKVLVDSMTEIESLNFKEPFGKMEAFYTSGGTSTLPKTLYGKIKNLDYKTIRYPGHCELFNVLLKMGMAGSRAIDLGDTKIVPRKLLGKLLTDYLPSGEPDAVLIRIYIKGKKDGKLVEESHDLIDLFDEKNNLSSMQRTTAFPVAIIAQMLASGKIKEKGVVPQELAVPPDKFMDELGKRNIVFKKK